MPTALLQKIKQKQNEQIEKKTPSRFINIQKPFQLMPYFVPLILSHITP